jgi:hypothetical protein
MKGQCGEGEYFSMKRKKKETLPTVQSIQSNFPAKNFWEKNCLGRRMIFGMEITCLYYVHLNII